ncbi:DUF808 domain-containing protein [Ornithinimicrobium cryptoxanthini]|uniref:DUF808 domain-containing protein n=1 Tax=Ornithinimicrobium cryptoxanthini TaxID=2934161 RepID=A0ABY4YLU4_9MICO|nr:DUF808 domain-containing protein [Ornithinimicrobium cryptoxanthini]USQ77490.1 DUF808 domain-containing protein [Ornithinimicrobium cryptoxanthini]
MAGGLVALLDDIAAIARIAAASVDDVAAAAGRAGSKSLGVVIDDAAVTPRYVTGAQAARELPIIKKIAIGSIRNKLLFILPAIMLLSQFVPWTLTPILMLGGSYLCYEGAEKVYELISGHTKGDPDTPAVEQGPEAEDKMVRGAITTDFILSAEIMVIALNEVAEEPFVSRAIILVVVAIGITALVYGAVALIIKMDDIGLRLAENESEFSTKLGLGLVKAMPIVLSVLSSVGIIAMLWVGGHIILVGMDELGFHLIYGWVHSAEEVVAGLIPAIGGVLSWLTNTLASAVLGLIWGGILVAVLHLLPIGRKDPVH